MSNSALVTIGVPVFQAERYLEETLDSLLAQTYRRLEIVITDNASTDGTEAICRRYLAADERIRYIRHAQNRGAAWNHSFAAHQARGSYFKWAAADDVCAPEFVERCVELLERDPSAVLCQPQTLEIDEHGTPIEQYRHPLRVTSNDLVERWTDLLMIGYACYHVYGVIRTEALLQTGLMGSFIESDMVLLAELSLRGRLAELDEPLFLHRLHPGQSVRVHENLYDRGAWFDARKVGLVFPTWRFALEYLRAIRRAPLDRRTQLRCLAATARWANYRRRSFARDFKVAARTLRRRLPGGLPAT